MNEPDTRTMMVRLAIWMILLGLCSPLAAQTTHIVTVGDNFFSPANLTIQAGDTVRWTNAAGGNSHNVSGPGFKSSTSNSFTFSQTFSTAGSFNYECTIHPSQMQGTITVEAAAPSPADLSLQSLNAPAGTFKQGENFTVSITTENIGGLASGSYTVNLYASADTQVTSGDTSAGAINRTALAAGAQDSFNAAVTIPATLAPGNYFIGGIIGINDADNGNNTKVDTTAITVVADSSDDFKINEGLNDAWYNPATPGQGFFITVFPDIQMMFLAWFTFDTVGPAAGVTAKLGEPGHRWLTAFGPYSGDSATLDVELTQGGTFNSAVPAVTQGADGTIEVDFSDCNDGLIHFDITSADVSGTVPIERIALDNVPFCEAQAATQ